MQEKFEIVKNRPKTGLVVKNAESAFVFNGIQRVPLTPTPVGVSLRLRIRSSRACHRDLSPPLRWGFH